jgi:hypothetical protein
LSARWKLRAGQDPRADLEVAGTNCAAARGLNPRDPETRRLEALLQRLKAELSSSGGA